ncbi:MAG: metallophosphoesterase family protein [Deferribacteres bacterium]|nr:metallophosphoesterase family protein [candidate division KSB1 bacterium]MCB9512182.1 metallophosphoesterase family protein [Deferribacteres bacterium]
MKIGIVSDTHGKMHPGVMDAFAGVDAIFHAGDIGNEDIITTLETIAPVYPVYGNVDTFPLMGKYPEVRLETLGGKRILMTHIMLLFEPKIIKKWLTRVDESEPPHVFIYGHTHKDRIEQLDGVLTINPGSAGPSRFRTRPSVAFLEIAENGEMNAWIHRLQNL